MKIRLFRVFILTLLCAMLTFIITVSVSAATFVQSGMCYFASTQYGEDASTMATIHFHSESSGVYALLTTKDDATFSKATKVELEKVKIDFSAPLARDPEKPLEQDEGFPENSWECTGRLTGLTPNTDYIWVATDGNSTSNVYNFRTAAGDNSTFTFSFTTDPQTYTGGDRWERYNRWSTQVYETARINNLDIAFHIDGGDVVENSGRAEHWSYLFGPNVFEKSAYMATPGNHDFSGLISSGSTDDRFFNAQWGNPLNGPDGYNTEACYFFKFNDTLFVSLSCSSISRSVQVEWLDKVLKENPAQYKVITMHYPMNSDATDNAKEFLPVVHKYNVDLVLFGHTHTYAVQKNYYNRKASSNEYLGTTFISASSPEGDYGRPVANQIFFTFNDKIISFKAFDPAGVSVQSFPLSARRVPTKDTQNFNEENFIKSIKAEIDQNTLNKGNITFDASAYNNIYKITLKDLNGTELGSKFVTDSVNLSIPITGLTPNTQYDTKLVFEYYDGTTKEVDFKFNTNLSYFGTLDKLTEKTGASGYVFTFIPNYTPNVKGIALYVDDVKVRDYAITDKKISAPFEYLPEGTRHSIQIRAVLADGSEGLIHESFYGEDLAKYVVKFVGKDGELLKEESVLPGSDATSPAAPVVEGFTFTGWDKEFTNVTEDLVVTALYEAKTKSYSVKFIGKDGSILKEETVEEGKAATSPAAPLVDGFTFKGWDKEFTNVTEDLVVTALYEEVVQAKTYSVKFIGKDGSILKEETVEEGKAATSPAAPQVNGFTFKGWDKEFTNVTEDLVVTALYEEVVQAKTYSVKFLGKDGKLLKEETVEEGKAATSPAAPQVNGFTFKGWDKEFTNVTENLVVTALYEEVVQAKTYSVKFLGKDGKLLKEETVEEGKAATSPAAPQVEGFTFKGWDKEFTNVTENLVVTALYEEVKASGCFNSQSVLLTCIMLLGVIILRRKKF